MTPSTAAFYVRDFEGDDIKASAADNLREEISAVLPQVKPGDELLVRVESLGPDGARLRPCRQPVTADKGCRRAADDRCRQGTPAAVT